MRQPLVNSRMLSIGSCLALLACAFTFVACGGGSTGAAPAAAPVVSPFVINAPKLVTEGDKCTASVPIQASGGYVWIIDGGTITGGDATEKISFTAGAPGALKLSCTAQGSSTTANANVLPLPRIESFEATPSTLMDGESSELKAVFSNGKGTIQPGNLPMESGTPLKVSPTVDTIYTLNVTNEAGGNTAYALNLKVVAAPAITAFSASSAQVTAGEPLYLSASFTGGTGVILPGNLPIENGRPVTVTPMADTAYTLTVTNSIGKYATQTLTAVHVVEAPSIDRFTAKRASLTSGESTELLPLFRSGIGVINPGNLPVESGKAISISPAADTVYRLTVTNAQGYRVTADAPVNVFSAPTISGFGASRTQLTAGEPLQLTATYVGQSAVINPGNLSVSSGVPITVLPSVDTTYKLTALNGAGMTVNQSLDVKVLPAQVIESFSASAPSITEGEPLTLTAVYRGGDAVLMPGDARIESGRPVTVFPKVDTTYTLILTNSLGKVSASVLDVQVIKAPVIQSFQIANSGITAGDPVEVTPLFIGGTGVITPGDLPVTSGMPITLKPEGDTSYTLTVTNALGRKATQILTLHTFPLPTIGSFTGSAPAVSQGDALTLTAQFAGGTGLITPGNLPIQSGTPLNLNPQASMTYTLTVTNGAGKRATLTVDVQVVSAPAIQTFSAQNASVAEGDSALVTAGFSGGSGVITPGDLVVESYKPVSLAITGDVTYTLTVTNSLGKKTSRTLSVNLVRNPTIESFTVDQTTVTQGENLTFTATYANGVGRLTGGLWADLPSGKPVSVAVNYPVMGAGSDATFTLSVSNQLGKVATQTVTVKVLPRPWINAFKAYMPMGPYSHLTEVASVPMGSTVQLVADFNGVNGNITPGDKAIESSYTWYPGGVNWKPVSVIVNTDTTYTLTVSNGGTFGVTRTLDLKTIPLKLTEFKAKPAYITAGEASVLSWTVEGATSVKLDHAFGEVIGQFSKTIKPTETITYTLTAQNGVGDSQTATAKITVVPRPVITSFTVESGRINPGQAATLKAVFDAGPEGTAVIEGIGSVESGVLIQTPNLDYSRSYTLVVTNAAGVRITAKANVMVTGAGLDIRISGLPEGVDANVGVNCSSGSINKVIKTSELIPNAYSWWTVSPSAVFGPDGTLYQASPGATGTLDWGGCGARVDIVYTKSETKKITLPGGLAYEFVLVPAGTYRMNPYSRVGYMPNDRQANNEHMVTFAQPFFMGRTEVTQAQWVALMDRNPSMDADINENYPVGQVSWDMAKAFVAKLQALEGCKEVRLPSEAEWEYAARTAMDDPVSYGGGMMGGFPNNANSGWMDRWGCYGMNSNATEWCEDGYHPELKDAPTDGSAWTVDSLSGHVYRSVYNSRPSEDSSWQRTGYSREFGLRLVMPIPIPPQIP